MINTKVKFGIDLGTTNSSICSFDDGKAFIYKTDTQKDTMPSCVAYLNKKQLAVGDSAFNFLRDERSRATKNWTLSQNSFTEFKRTMGLDKNYHSDNAKKDFSSEELSAEVLKQLKSFTKENFSAAIITVPAKFKSDQIAATKRAAELAGITQCALLQEPVAAAIAYGINSSNKDGTWVVFDFGGGTFDVALLKVEDGIIVVKDTDGDNYLGGKNIDYAIIDQIFLPHLRKNYSLNSLDDDYVKLAVLRDALKYYAETAKIALSQKDSYHIVSSLDEFGLDDNGKSLELDVVVDNKLLKKVCSPFYQKAIDLTINLMNRNNLNGDSIDSLILVGGPTLSPIFREMLSSEVTKNISTDISPMTAVSVGAAMYAQTIDVQSEIDENQDTVALNVVYEASTVSDLEFVAIRPVENEYLTKLKQGNNDNLYIEVSSSHWSSGKLELEPDGNVFEIPLIRDTANEFRIKLTDIKGNIISSFPDHFNIIQGSKFSNAVLPYSYGIEIRDGLLSTEVFAPLKGLEKNQALPAEGVIQDLKLLQGLIAGDKASKLVVPIYQGEYDAADSNCIASDHVFDVVITGEEVPVDISLDSRVSVTLKVDKSQFLTMLVSIFRARHEQEEPIVIEKFIDVAKRQALSQNDLLDRIKNARVDLEVLDGRIGFKRGIFEDYQKKFDEIEKRISLEGDTDEGRMILVNEIRNTYLNLEKFRKDHISEYVSSMLDDELERLEELADSDFTDADKIKKEYSKYKRKINAAKKSGDFEILKELYFEITKVSFDISPETRIFETFFMIVEYFDSITWKNKQEARRIIADTQKKISTLANSPEDALYEVSVALEKLLNGNIALSDKLLKI